MIYSYILSIISLGFNQIKRGYNSFRPNLKLVRVLFTLFLINYLIQPAYAKSPKIRVLTPWIATNLTIQQTFFIDHIGRSENHFTMSPQGSAMDIDEQSIVGHLNNPLHIGSPFWYLFTEHPYHYINMKRVIHHFQDIARFVPATTKLPPIAVLTTLSFTVEIQNTGNDTLTIYDIWSASRLFFIPKIEGISIPPRSHTNLTFYVCPSQEGCFSTPIFFSTNKGEIPYTVTHCAHYPMKDYHINPLKYMSASNCSFSLRIPSQLKTILQKKPNVNLLFDASIFSHDRTDYEINRIFFDVKQNVKPGYYLSFITMSTPFTMVNIPLFISMSQRYLQANEPVIVTPVVNVPNETIYYDVELVNPTAHNFALLSANLYKETSTIKFETMAPPLVCPRHTKTLIGRIKITGDKEGTIDTSLLIAYEGIKPQVTQTIDIPIKASVCFGYLKPSAEKIVLLRSTQETYTFKFTNYFKTPVFIISASINSTFFSIKPLLVNIVEPGDESPNVVINLPRVSVSRPIITNLVVETNATTLIIPLHMYTGEVFITDSEKGTPMTNSVTFYPGVVLCGSSANYTVWVSNENSEPFIIRKAETSLGIYLNDGLTELFIGKYNEFVCPPFSVAKFEFCVTYNKVKQAKPRTDTFVFYGDYSNFQVSIAWTPRLGEFSFDARCEKAIIVGKHYDGELYISSTFQQHVKIMDVRTLNNGVDLSASRPFVKPMTQHSAMTFIGNFSYDVDERFLSSFPKLSELMNADKPWNADLQTYDQMWSNASDISIVVLVYLKNGMFYYFEIPISIQKMRLHDKDYNFGIVSVNTETSIRRKISNILEIPMRFVFHNATNCPEDAVITSNKSIIVPGMDSEYFVFNLKKASAGIVDAYVPATSNSTGPLFLHIVANVVSPNIDIIDSTNTPVKSLVFNREDDRRFIGRTWVQSYYIRNLGQTNIDVSLKSLDDQPLKNYNYIIFELNCTKLEPGMQCPVIVGVNLMKLPNRYLNHTLNFTIHDILYSYNIEIIVSEGTANFLRILKETLISIFTALAFISPLHSLYLIISERSKLMSVVKSKRKNRDQEIYNLSMSVKVTVETQCQYIQEEAGSGGRFVIVDAPSPETLIDERSLINLEELIISA